MSIDADIDAFNSEGGDSVTGTGVVRVSEILSRGIPIHWDEAVAVLQEMLHILVSTGREELPVPGFDDVVIDHEGAVTLHRTGRGERGPVAAGRALHALLATADVPVALRLFVTQANAPETHASLREFADGLAYFGKPGRAELIRAIYERYKAAAGTTAAPAPHRPSPTPPLPGAARAQPRARRERPRWLIPVAITVCIASAAAAIRFGALGGGRGKRPAVVSQAKAAIAAVGVTVQSTVAGLNTKTPAPMTHAPTRQSGASAPLPLPRQHASATSVASPAALDVRTASLERPRAAENEAARTTPRIPEAPTPDVFPSTAPLVAAIDERLPRRGTTATIYSPDDADVRPPVMMYPQLPPPLMIGAPSDGLVNRMELVIAADGTVERVRLVNPPRRMADMMLLSGAKLWKFTPAVKDGEPVRYRTIVSWTVFP